MTETLEKLFPVLAKLIPAAGTLVLVLVGMFIVHRFILKAYTTSTGKKFRNQMIMLALSAAGALMVLVMLPIEDETRGQFLGFLGIVLSAGIALASTTLLGSAMAGLMIRAVRAFHLGEFIELGDHFGRVSDMGLFHVEIQTEDRDLTTLPNLLFVTNAVKRIRPSGTILSARISLGYDMSPARVQRLLLEAATDIGLKDPFARVLNLGDHAVTYKVAGLLEDVSKLLAKRSDLRVAMIHSLHSDGVEIVSPQFRNNRMIGKDQLFIPPTNEQLAPVPQASPDAVVFDKAEEAASLESLRTTFSELEKRKEAVHEAMKEHENQDLAQDKEELAHIEQRLQRTAEVIAAREDQAAKKD